MDRGASAHELVKTMGVQPRATIDELLAWTSLTLDTRAGAERETPHP